MNGYWVRAEPAAFAILMLVALQPLQAADAGLSNSDRLFLSNAAQGGLLEVTAGKLAEQRGSDPAVKAYGQKMVADHTAANEKLKSLADSKQMPLPNSLSAKERNSLDKLETLNGDEFDRAYARMMVKDHTEDVEEFEHAAKTAKDSDVRAFAATTLPTLRHHLVMANQMSFRGASPAPTRSE